MLVLERIKRIKDSLCGIIDSISYIDEEIESYEKIIYEELDEIQELYINSKEES